MTNGGFIAAFAYHHHHLVSPLYCLLFTFVPLPLIPSLGSPPRARPPHINSHAFAIIMPPDPHAVLGLQKTATVDEIKRAFRERAKALHPDTSHDARDVDAFHALKSAYETLLKRRGAKADDDEGGGIDDAYGPGMRARMTAARAWREQSERRAGGVAPAREWTRMRAGEAAEEGANATENLSVVGKRMTRKAFDAETQETLDSLLEARRRARGSGGSLGVAALETRGRGRALALVGVGLVTGLIFTRKLMHKMEKKHSVSE